MATSLQMLPNVDNPVERILPNQWHILCATSLPPPPSQKKLTNKKNIRKSSWKVRNSVPYLLCLVYLPFFVINSIARKSLTLTTIS